MKLLRRLFRRSTIDDEIREEMETHIAMRADVNRKSGMSSDEALQSARKQFGNLTRLREALYEFNGFGFLDTVLRDLRYSLRTLMASKGFTAAAILSLALGIGANCAVFSILDAAILKDLPIKDPDR